MERYLYNRLINIALDAAKEKRSFSDDIINRLQFVNSLNQGVINTSIDLSSIAPIENLSINKVSLSSYSDTNVDINPPTPLLPLSVSAIETLFDGTFLVQHSFGLTHYTKDYNVIQVFPFDFVSPTLTSEYLPTGKLNVLNVDNISYIFIPNDNIIQMYSYDGLTFLHAGFIGNLTSSGTTPGLLLEVKCISSDFLDTGSIRLFVSGGLDTTSYIKQIIIQSDSSIESESLLLSYTATNKGLMTLNGVYNIVSMASELDFLYLTSLDTKQLGVFNLNSQVFEIVYEDKIKDIGNNDFLVTPNSITLYNNTLVCSDKRGHIFIINPDLSVGVFHGQPKETVFNTNYPFSFSSITFVSVSDGKIFGISQGEIFTSNLLSYINEQTVSLSIISPPTDTRIKNIYGLCDVKISYKDKNNLSICDMKDFIIPQSTSISITFKRPESENCSEEGFVVFEIC